jgi:dTDP-4-amino-4,6-dideoxygalactose transaminase
MSGPPTPSPPAAIPVAGVERESAALRAPVLRAAAGVLERGRFILGPEVAAFESEVGAYLGGAHAVGCASGTDALVLALRALEIGPGDEVVVPAFTFAATAEAVVLTGATPVFADVEPDTFGIDARSVAALVGPRTRAVVPVHLFGQCARMEPILALAERHALRVVEDAAQAIGARWRGKAAGALGHAAAFSFYPTKNLGAPGDGGLATTTDARVAERLRRLRSHGSREAHVHEAVGTNSRLDELHAAVLRVKLPLLDRWNDRRRATAARYREAIASAPRSSGGIVAPVEVEGAHHVYHHFTVRTARRAELQAWLASQGIGSAVYYPRALHEQPAYARWARGRLPGAERAAAEVLSVPVHPWLADDEVETVATALAAFT